MNYLCTNIEYDREEGETLPDNLPKTILISSDDPDDVADAISDRTGFCVSDFDFQPMSAQEASTLLTAAMCRWGSLSTRKDEIEGQFTFELGGKVLSSHNPDVVFGCLIEDELENRSNTETE